MAGVSTLGFWILGPTCDKQECLEFVNLGFGSFIWVHTLDVALAKDNCYYTHLNSWQNRICLLSVNFCISIFPHLYSPYFQRYSQLVRGRSTPMSGSWLRLMSMWKRATYHWCDLSWRSVAFLNRASLSALFLVVLSVFFAIDTCDPIISAPWILRQGVRGSETSSAGYDERHQAIRRRQCRPQK